MNASEPVGTVRALWRFPVKSMLGEELDAADMSEGGVVGDRAYALRRRVSTPSCRASSVALARHNRIDVAGAMYPCAGVYAVAEATGTIHKDDRVSLV